MNEQGVAVQRRRSSSSHWRWREDVRLRTKWCNREVGRQAFPEGRGGVIRQQRLGARESQAPSCIKRHGAIAHGDSSGDAANEERAMLVLQRRGDGFGDVVRIGVSEHDERARPHRIALGYEELGVAAAKLLQLEQERPARQQLQDGGVSKEPGCATARNRASCRSRLACRCS